MNCIRKHEDLYTQVVDALSDLIRLELRGAAGEQYHLSFDADAMDRNIDLGKRKAAALRDIRQLFENEMTGVLI